MKIFWSWQSDTPETTGRYFVRDALIEAVAQLKIPEDIDLTAALDEMDGAVANAFIRVRC